MCIFDFAVNCPFKDVYIQTCRAHLYYHITASALYMISHHITNIMIGWTLQSMLVILYRRHQHASLDRQRWRAPSPHLDSSACCDKIKADKQKTQTLMAESHSWRPDRELIGLEGVIGFMVMSVPVTSRKRGMTSSSCKNVWDEAGHPSRLLQRCVDGARPERSWVRGGTHARRDCGRWASGGQEGAGFLANHIQLFIVLWFLWKWFIATGSTINWLLWEISRARPILEFGADANIDVRE